MNNGNDECCICGNPAYGKEGCFICGNPAGENLIEKEKLSFYTFDCEICGRFSIIDLKINKDMFAPYLFYKSRMELFNKSGVFAPELFGKRSLFIATEKDIAEVQKKVSPENLITDKEVKIRYPRTFSAKIDEILLGLSGLSKYDGSPILLKEEEIYSAFFVERYNLDNGSKKLKTELDEQLKFIFKYLTDNNLVEKINKDSYGIMILPEGLKRTDELQKNQSNNKNVFIAMAFTEDMKSVREAIRKAIINAGYIPIIMDEIEHNNQIVPEMLHKIRQSKFIVAEFTESNNGAYYEAGYAIGLGKEAIHVCRYDAFDKDGHFDIKQKNTVLWRTEDELTEKLCKRIEATIV